ncbi:MAG: hypothetical protein WC622_11125 [Pedobacter sp.]|jgi:hypothetical protein|uniref:hypothetical protein n=1 Tax=Pedobacter sp. TaxID=1411316 RepID=UPI003565D6CC
MSKTYETGHPKNLANFETLISFVIGFGATYNPSKTAIHLGNMQAQATLAKNAISNLNLILATHGNAVVDREIAFKPLQKLCTRILNSLKATDASLQVVDNLITLNRKIQGSRASAKVSKEEKATLLAQGKEINQVSTSQQSYDSLLDNFDKLVKLLASIPLYVPNETELKVTTLVALHANLKLKNATVVNAATTLSNARLTRNEILYHPETGIITTALDVKTYVKSVYGTSSPQYKQISALPFTRAK